MTTKTTELETMTNFIFHRNHLIEALQQVQRETLPWMLNPANRDITRAYRHYFRVMEEGVRHCNNPREYYSEVLPTLEKGMKNLRKILEKANNDCIQRKKSIAR